MEIRKREDNGIMVVSVTGKLDIVSSPELETCMTELIDQTAATVILDFSNLRYISSAGLRVVLAATKKLKGQGRQLVLAGLTGPVKDVIHFSGFHTIITIFDTTAQALENEASP